MMQIKVKPYGLIEFTKKQYIITQAIVFGILFVGLFFALGAYYNDTENVLWEYAYMFTAIIIFLELLETLYMMIKFKKEESRVSED